METFFGESMLKPYVHYVPLLEDLKDLEKVLWCEAHLDKCEASHCAVVSEDGTAPRNCCDGALKPKAWGGVAHHNTNTTLQGS